MEQLYSIEILLDTIRIYVSDENIKQKSIITKIRFGPNVEFIIKENELVADDNNDQPNTIQTNENGQKYYSRSIRIGKSYFFPAHPDTILTTLSKFPLDLEVWTDDNEEEPVYIGNGSMRWNRQFYRYVKDTTDSRKVHEGFTIKSRTMLYAECCCAICGEVYFLLRLTALGPSIITEFQELKANKGHFVFRTNKTPTMLDCFQTNGTNPNFCMIGVLYETTTLQEPKEEKELVCTELDNCADECDNTRCKHDEEKPKKEYPIDKIKMGDIKGPCGNTNCPLAHKVKMYIRSLDTYKAKAASIKNKPADPQKNVCGKCVCTDDRWHRDDCPTKQANQPEPKECCDGKTDEHHTCDPQVNYVFKLPDGFREAVYGNQFFLHDCSSSDFTDENDDDVLSDSDCSNTTQSNTSLPVCECTKVSEKM